MSNPPTILTPPASGPPPPSPVIPGLGKEGEAAAIWVRIDVLRGWQGNPRRFEPEHVQEIAGSMKRFGWGAPILARSPDDPEVLAGHVRLLAGQLLTVPVAPVRYMVHLSPAEAHALAIADNALAEKSRWDEALLEQAVREIDRLNKLAAAAAPAIDLRTLGLREKRLADMLAEAPKVDILEVDLGKLRDEFFVTVRGPVPAQPEVLERLREALGQIEGARVEIGVVLR